MQRYIEHEYLKIPFNQYFSYHKRGMVIGFLLLKTN